MKYSDNKFYRVVRCVVCFIFRIIFRPNIIISDFIPSEGKIILAGNHISILDPILIMCSTKRQIHFLAKKELFTGFKGVIFRHLGLISVDRNRKDNNALNYAREYLNNDLVVGIFPEGTTEKSNYPNLLEFKYGAVKLSKDTESKIIPFRINGKYKIFGKKVNIILGKPLKKLSNLEEYNKLLYNVVDSMKEV